MAKLGRINSRWVWLVMGVLLVWAALKPVTLPLRISPDTQRFPNVVAGLRAGSIIPVGASMGPGELVAQHVDMPLAFDSTVAYTWQNTRRPIPGGTAASPGMATGAWWLVLPILFALLVYPRYGPRRRWVARYPMSLWLGCGAGVIPANMPKTFMGQVVASFHPLWGNEPITTYINGWIPLIALLGTLAYFLFTVARKGSAMRLGAGIGRWTLMSALGASFAATVLFRWTLAHGQVRFPVQKWLGL